MTLPRGGILVYGLYGISALSLGAIAAVFQLDNNTRFTSDRLAGPAEGAIAQVEFNNLPAATINDFNDLLERPLFAATRRPFTTITNTVPAANATGEKLLLGKFRFSGIIITGETKIAYLIAPGATETLKIEPGDMLEGWKVTEITREQIILRSGSDEQAFQIRSNEN